MTINVFLFVAFFSILVGLPTGAQAELITFDDISVKSDGWGVISKYKGLTWTGFVVRDAEHKALTKGQAKGLVSASNVLLGSSISNLATFSSSDPFSFTSGYFTKSIAGTAEITLTALLGDEQKYSHTFNVSNTGPAYVSLNWANINKVTVTALVDSPIVVDSLTISAVPLPAAAPLFAGAVLALGALRRANQRRRSV